MPELSDTKIRSAKPREGPYKLFDVDGLFLIKEVHAELKQHGLIT